MTIQEQVSKVRDAIPRAGTFVTEVRSEVRKVVWPTRKETYAATLVVVVISVIIALFLGVVDFAISFVVRGILS